MTVEEALRLIAGALILASVLLAVTVSPYFLLFTGFVGLNLLQSAFTRWCPMMTLLKWAGLRQCIPAGGDAPVPRMAR
jgi:H+/gluconate symporter-like permease